MLGRPLVDLAAPAVGEAHQAFEQFVAQQAEHGLRALLAVGFGCAGHGDVGAFAFGRLAQALHQVGREQRRVARHGDQPGGVRLLQSGEEAGQRPGKVGLGVGPDGHAERLVGRQVAVGIDHRVAHLRLQPQQRIQRQRHAVEILQALVGAAHAGAATACEHDAGDLLRVHQPPM